MKSRQKARKKKCQRNIWNWFRDFPFLITFKLKFMFRYGGARIHKRLSPQPLLMNVDDMVDSNFFFLLEF